MTTRKHLVLDDDVYLKLKRRKARSKFSAKAIGNSLLRSALSHPSLFEVIGRVLVDMEKLSPEEYKQVVAEAERQIQVVPHRVSEVMKVSERKTFISGSWEWKEIWKSPDEGFQVLECWARDKKKVSIPAHYHREREFVIVLAGRVNIQTETESHILEPGGFFCISPDLMHSAAPLTADARAVAISVPASKEYEIDK